MLALMEVIDSDMDLRATGHPASQLLAEEKIGMAAQVFRTLDAIVIGEREKIHAPVAQAIVNLQRIAITLPTESGHNRSGARSGKIRVDMHIALHDLHSKSTALQKDDNQANVLKTKAL